MNAATEAYIAKLLATAPEPTDEQIAGLQALFDGYLPPLVEETGRTQPARVEMPTSAPRRPRRPRTAAA